MPRLNANVHSPEVTSYTLPNNPFHHPHQFHSVPYPAYVVPHSYYFETERAQLLADKSKLEGELRKVAKTVDLYRQRFGPLDSSMSQGSSNINRNAVITDLTHSSPSPTPATVVTTRRPTSNEPMSLRSIINGPSRSEDYASRAGQFTRAMVNDDVPSLQVNPARIKNAQRLGLTPHFIQTDCNGAKRKLNELAQFARLKKQQRTR
mmetsp:Transcript_11897/g.13093  ORF Transcript_11897/g.13093 Transcript_11897/m.13093 type:complete len:206 (-) Transcript_11897:148-765(-)